MVLLNGFLIRIVVILLTTNNVWGRKMYGYIDNVDCSDYNPNYISKIKCWIEPGKHNLGMINAVLAFKKDVTSIFCYYRFVTDWTSKNITYISLNIDICLSLKAAFSNQIMRLISEELRQVSNFSLECPFHKDKDYLMNNFSINPRMIPSYAPRLKWFNLAFFYTDSSMKVMLLRYVSSGRLDKKPERKSGM